MVLVEIDEDEIMKQAELVRDLGLRLYAEAQTLWSMSKVKVNRKSAADGDTSGTKD